MLDEGEIFLLRLILTTVLSGILLGTTLGIPTAWAQTRNETRLTEQTRAAVQKAGVGRDARVEIKLRDNTKLKGYVSAAGADSFTVTDTKTGAAQTLAYADVARVQRQGNGLSGRTKAIIGAAVATGLVVTWLIVKPALCDGGAQSRGPC